MTTASLILAVQREPIHSLNRVDDDAAILAATADRLRADGLPVEVVEPGRLPALRPAPLVLAMCCSPAALARLAEWERRGSTVINAVSATLATARSAMATRFPAGALPFPTSAVVPTDDPDPLARAGAWASAALETSGLWVKRGDLYTVEPQDVMRVWTAADVRAAVARLRRTGVPEAVLQRHVEGEVVKFYRVAGSYFTWFYHNPAARPARPPDEGRLAIVVAEAGEQSGLEVYGGDIVAAPDGGLWLIDVNAWPSFARVRSAAAEAIARHIRTLALSGRRGRARA
jgi:hypothetical protein